MTVTVRVNQGGVRKARALIDAHQYVLESSWSGANPSANDENAFIERNGWEQYGEWHLAVDEDSPAETKERFSFPYGDFHRVHRSGLIAAKQRAAQLRHDDIERAADELLVSLDKRHG